MKILLLLLLTAISAPLFAQRIENLGKKINTAYSEISPCLSPAGELFFVRSNYPGNTFGANDSQDIWYSKKTEVRDTSWTEPIHLPINNARYNAVLAVLHDGALLINGVFNKKGNFFKKRGLSICPKEGLTWGAPKSLGINVLARRSEGVFGGGDMSADQTRLVVSFSKIYNGQNSDIFMFTKNKNGDWGSIDKLSTVNSLYDEENPSFADNGKTLYFSSNRTGNRELYKSYYVNNRWTKPELVPLKSLNTVAWESSFRVDAKEEWAYFSSTRLGRGNADIFRVRLPQKGKFIKVKGLVYNEQTKALMKGEAFTILVNGKPSLTSHVNADSASYWAVLPKDTTVTVTASKEYFKGVPKEVNTGTDWDEFDLELKPEPYIWITGKIIVDGGKEPLSGKAIRAIAMDGKTIESVIDTTQLTYSIKVPREGVHKKSKLSADVLGYKSKEYEMNIADIQNTVKKEIDLHVDYVEKRVLLVISGKLLDQTTKAPIDPSKNPTVVVLAKGSDARLVYDPATGRYEISLAPDNYVITAKADNYFPMSEPIEGRGKTTVEKDMFLTPAVQGKSIQLNHILFIRGTPKFLHSSSDVELENLLAFMQQNPKVEILIGGHTDNQGSYNLNKKLSEARAGAVRQYLADKGIQKGRLQFKGFGPDKPVAPNNTEVGRQLNRRVEVTLLTL